MSFIVIQVPPGDCLCLGPILTGGGYSMTCDRDNDGMIVIEVPDGSDELIIIGSSFRSEDHEEPSGANGDRRRVVPPFPVPRFVADGQQDLIGLVDLHAFGRAARSLESGKVLTAKNGMVKGAPWLSVKEAPTSIEERVPFESLEGYTGKVKLKAIGTFSPDEKNVETAILEFFNKVNDPEELVKRIKDNPETGTLSPRRYGMRLFQAKNVIAYRDRKVNRRFDSTAELIRVHGIGEDTISDIFYSFKIVDLDQPLNLTVVAQQAYVELIDGMLRTSNTALGALATVRKICPQHVPETAMEVQLRDVMGELHGFRSATVGGQLQLTVGAPALVGTVQRYSKVVKPGVDFRALGNAPGAFSNVMPTASILAMVPPTPPLGGIPPAELETLIALVEEILGVLRPLIGTLIDGTAGEEIATLIAQLERQLAAIRAGTGNPNALWRMLARLLRAVLAALARITAAATSAEIAAAAEAMLSRLGAILARLAPFARFFAFLGPFLWVLFAADVGWALGSAIAEIEVGDGETVGTWWGRRIWELLSGPCPELLEGLNLAIYEWRQAEHSGTAEDAADALARVLALESEYISRCLELGSEEWRQEKLFERRLRRQLKELLNDIISDDGDNTAPPDAPQAPQPAPPPVVEP